MDIAISLIKQNQFYLLQRRDWDSQTSKAGGSPVGCFGGKIEEGESAIEAICREIREETSLRPRPEDFRLLGSLALIEPPDDPIKATVFMLDINRAENVDAEEGRLVRLSELDVAIALGRLTLMTQMAFEQFILGKG